MLVEQGVISEQQLKLALSEQKSSGKKIGQTLLELGFLDEHQILEFQAQQLNLQIFDFEATEINPQHVQLLNESLAKRYRALVVNKVDNIATVVMSDPSDIFAIDELQTALGCTIQPIIAKDSVIIEAIDRFYGHGEGSLSSIAIELESELGFEEEQEIVLDDEVDDDDNINAPVVRLIQSIFEDAIKSRASDIHIEPDENVLRIRRRVDGTLQEQIMKEKRVAPALVMRLKIMSSLDISEKRKPQDGRFQMTASRKTFDVRISTLPTQHGESVVMRILDQSALKLDLKQIGMPPDILRRFELFIARPHGIVLVTGPTGSGKTTTLYSALSSLNAPGVKIITAEDPVEFRLPRIQQVQVNEKVGLTFAGVLRSALRQDPDVVLVGEIRDKETSEIALKAAMTGHLVLSSLHTNDAISSAIRLVDMGAPAYMVAGSVTAVIAQRLVRKTCDRCIQPYTLSAEEKTWLKIIAGNRPVDFTAANFQEGTGCNHCNKTGHYGRVGVYEILEMTRPLADRLRREDISGFAREALNSPDYETLAMAALRYALQGIISPREVFRLASSLEDHVIDDEPTAEPTPADQPTTKHSAS